MTLQRVASTLPPELDDLITDTIGALLVVHRELGPGMGEGVYAAATTQELAQRRMPFETEKQIPVRYKGNLLCYQRVDLLWCNARPSCPSCSPCLRDKPSLAGLM